MNVTGSLCLPTLPLSLNVGTRPPTFRRMHEKVRELARVLDQQHKPHAPISVRGKRATLLRHFKARKRGGPLYCGEHELQLVTRSRGATIEGELWNG